jgi:hypothetical protein
MNHSITEESVIMQANQFKKMAIADRTNSKIISAENIVKNSTKVW